MSRGLTDPIEEPAQDGQSDNDQELDAVINELIKGQNKLHDRLVDLERIIDHMVETNNNITDTTNTTKSKWKRGL